MRPAFPWISLYFLVLILGPVRPVVNQVPSWEKNCHIRIFVLSQFPILSTTPVYSLLEAMKWVGWLLKTFYEFLFDVISGSF